jgi:hypothetical protein
MDEPGRREPVSREELPATSCAPKDRALLSIRTLMTLISRRSHRRGVRAAWDSLSAELLPHCDQYGVRGTSYRFEPPRLIVYSDDPARSRALLPTYWLDIPVRVVPSADYPAP